MSRYTWYCLLNCSSRSIHRDQFFPLIYITWARRWESACTYLDVGDGAGELLGVEHQDGQVTQVAVARVAHLLRSRDRRVSPAPKI